MAAENCRSLQFTKFYRCASQVKKVQMHTKSLVQKSNDLTDLCSIIMDLGENGFACIIIQNAFVSFISISNQLNVW